MDSLWEDNMPVIMNLIERTHPLEEVALENLVPAFSPNAAGTLTCSWGRTT